MIRLATNPNAHDDNETQANGRQGMARRRAPLLLSVLAVVTMGTATVACSPRADKPAETSTTTAPSASATEKGMHTNVTRTPMAVTPPGAGGNPAVPCGFGPRGGGPCGNNG